MAHRITAEIDVEERISDILKKFINQKFNGITIVGVKRQYDVEGRHADIAVLKDDNKPILLIETKKKYEKEKVRPSVERRFMPTSEGVVGQPIAYTALLKRKDVYIPFIATANESQLALFTVPDNIDQLVDWDAIDKRYYDKVIKDFYKFRDHNLVFHKLHKFSDNFFKELLDTITGIYVKKFKVEDKKQELHWVLIEDFRGFVDFMAPFIQDAISSNGKFKDDIDKNIEKYYEKVGYKPTVEGLSREMAYVLLNKIIFYKVLERNYKLPKLEPLHEIGEIRTCNAYLNKLNEYFDKAIEVSNDFEVIFKTGIYDAIEVVESEEVIKTLDWFIRLIDHYKIEKLGDVIGVIYEELIPAEERHNLGQFYTPRPIAELIIKWAIRSPDDKVIDAGCGSGTFLVEAYKKLAESKLKKPFGEIKHVPEDVHKQILEQLYAIDINEFPAHLTAMNLAMKNVRVPSQILNIFVKDYFTIKSGYKTIAPYKAKTLEGEKDVEVEFKDFDAVVGNPPYTRWGELSSEVQNHIITSISDLLKKYDLIPQAGKRGAEYNMVVFWVAHSIGFLKDGGRLGMIISDSWLQTAYGVRFGRLLADHFKIHAIIDISARVFPVPLIGSCIVLLEKDSNESERRDNNIAFVYLKIKKGGINVLQVLKLVKDKNPVNISTEDYDIVVKVYKQNDVMESSEPWIRFLFYSDDILNQLRALEGKLLVRLEKYFEPIYGNLLYTLLYTRRVVRTRHAGVGGEEFFYLTDANASRHAIPQEFLVPLISSSRHMQFFSFAREDWKMIRGEGGECWLFLCHKPRDELQPEIVRYIQLGETEVRLAKGIHRGEPVSQSRAAEERRRLRQHFVDWYDLGGVIEAPIYATYGAQYWIRFVLSKFQCALDHRILALIPKQGAQFNEIELKALLAYLNSSFTQLQAEVMGRSTGGGMIELDVRSISSFLVLNVKALPKNDIKSLVELFDKLETEARNLGGADTAENVYGSELAKELTGRNNIKPNIQGLFNTIIKEIDYEVAKILDLDVENIRTLVLTLIARRLSRAQETKSETITSEEKGIELKKTKKRTKNEDPRTVRRLNEFF
jgi:type I restriction-modification system DNA methylase subunit